MSAELGRIASPGSPGVCVALSFEAGTPTGAAARLDQSPQDVVRSKEEGRGHTAVRCGREASACSAPCPLARRDQLQGHLHLGVSFSSTRDQPPWRGPVHCTSRVQVPHPTRETVGACLLVQTRFVWLLIICASHIKLRPLTLCAQTTSLFLSFENFWAAPSSISFSLVSHLPFPTVPAAAVGTGHFSLPVSQCSESGWKASCHTGYRRVWDTRSRLSREYH